MESVIIQAHTADDKDRASPQALELALESAFTYILRQELYFKVPLFDFPVMVGPRTLGSADTGDSPLHLGRGGISGFYPLDAGSTLAPPFAQLDHRKCLQTKLHSTENLRVTVTMSNPRPGCAVYGGGGRWII